MIFEKENIWSIRWNNYCSHYSEKNSHSRNEVTYNGMSMRISNSTHARTRVRT